VDVRLRRQGHQERQVVDAAGDLGEDAADPSARLAVTLERERALHHLAGCARGRLDVAPRVERLAVATVQLRLVVEGVHLADAAVHEELDHPLRPGAMMETAIEVGDRPRACGIHPGDQVVAAQQIGQRDPAQAAAHPPEEFPSR
jgi:hypothetical protein